MGDLLSRVLGIQQQHANEAYNNTYGSYLGAMNGLNSYGNVETAGGFITTGTSNPYWSSRYLVMASEAITVAAPSSPKPETEVEWLKRRVDEVCWKQAA